jgi:DNA-binding Lrp family transcriptional regulator
MKEITELFEKKLKPAIAPSLKAHDTIIELRKKVEDDRQEYLKKIEASQTNITEFEKTLDDRIIAGKNADDILQKIGSEQAKKSAYQRHIQRLTDQDIEAEAAEKNANSAIAEAIGKQLEALRPDVQALIEDKLWEIVGTLVSFEASAREVCEQTGATLQKDLEKSVFRFLNLDAAQKHIEAFTGQIGEDFSVIRRRDAAKYYFALLDERAKKDAA